MELRPYQSECIAEIERRGGGRWLCQLATGLGKTVIFSKLPRYGDILILSHREELVRQPLRYFDCAVGVEMAGSRAPADAPVVSASVQTICRRLQKFDPARFHTVIVDEAHHAAAKTYRDILDHFRPSRVIGFTATPNRADGLGLEGVFDEIIFERDLKWGIMRGYLSPILCRRINIGYDLSKVAVRMGDYAPGALERAVNIDSCNAAIAEVVRTIAEPPVLIFAVDVAHAEAIAAGIPGAVALSAKSRDRDNAVAAYRRGEIPVLVNCGLFTEGTDLPGTKTVMIARPTKSAALYTQMVGRGTRLAEGKSRCLLIDCIGVSDMPLCTAPTLLGLDLDAVPTSCKPEIEGDLLADIPELIERGADTPESWVSNIRIVNLWAKAQGYVLHDVNYIKLASGSLRVRLPKGSMEISAPDLTGKAVFSTSGGYTVTLKAQKAYDLAYECLRAQFSECRPLWSLSSAKRWGRGEANERQVSYIRRLASRRRVDVSNVLPGLTKLQAAQLIERMK